ncbi:MAG: glycosyltransferase family 39 protein, partial [Planctomycetes bacterium]|nr:glycosyltransferase family 39 protein [Planctomycetota bacterium]
PFLEKPPLYFWLVATSFLAFGVNEFAARLPTVLLGLLGVGATRGFGRKVLGKSAGFLGALALATSVEYIILSRYVVLDMALCVFVSLALMCFYVAYIRGSGGALHYFLMYVSMGLGVLTKGPLGVALPGVIIFLFLLVRKDLRALGRMGLWWGVLVFLAVVVPWYVLAMRAQPGFAREFLWEHNVLRFATTRYHRRAPAVIYAGVILFGLFPWSVFLPSTVRHIFSKTRRKPPEGQPALVFLLLWAGFTVTFFSLARTKLPAYIFSAFPAMALLVGWFLDRCLSERDPAADGPAPRLSAGTLFLAILCILGVVAGVAFVCFGPTDYGPAVMPPLWMLGALGSAALFLRVLNKERLIVVVCLPLICLIEVVVATCTVPTLDPLFSNKHLGELARRLAGPKDQFWLYHLPIESTVFYTQAKVTKVRNNLDEVLRSEGRAFVFARLRNLLYLQQAAEGRAVLLGQSGDTCLFTNKPMPSP